MSQTTRHHRLVVREVRVETHDSKSIVLDVPPSLAERFRYRPGQFLTLRLPVAGRHLPRCYSMSSAPALDEGLRVTVKRVTAGRGSNWLCDHVRAGDSLEVLPPAGVFTPRRLDGDFLLLAGGSGITPVFSILRSVLAAAAGRILLVYANRDERSVIFRDELRSLSTAHPSRLTVVHWLDSVQGVPSSLQLAELVRPMRGAQAFVCGPAAFMDAGVAALQSVGMAPDDIHIERFVSLPEEDPVAAEPSPAAPPGAPAPGLPAHADVEIAHQGQVHRIRCTGRETVLEVALRHGIDLPHSCRAGLCASCMCQVVEGQVQLMANESLDDKDLARGWTLACQAVPVTAQVRVRFAE